MKTFDIALKHLQGVDFTPFSIFGKEIKSEDASPQEKELKELIEKRHQDFSNDKDNNTSNSYYRNIVFLTAVFHLVFKAKDMASPFDVACEIIESESDILKNKFETFSGTDYPKIMVDKWIKYCNDLKLRTTALEGELRLDYFFTAFHYLEN